MDNENDQNNRTSNKASNEDLFALSDLFTKWYG